MDGTRFWGAAGGKERSRGGGELAARMVPATDHQASGKGASHSQARKPKQVGRKAGTSQCQRSSGGDGGIWAGAQMGLLGLGEGHCSPVVPSGFRHAAPTTQMRCFWFWRHKDLVKCPSVTKTLHSAPSLSLNVSSIYNSLIIVKIKLFQYN